MIGRPVTHAPSYVVISCCYSGPMSPARCPALSEGHALRPVPRHCPSPPGLTACSSLSHGETEPRPQGDRGPGGPRCLVVPFAPAHGLPSRRGLSAHPYTGLRALSPRSKGCRFKFTHRSQRRRPPPCHTASFYVALVVTHKIYRNPSLSYQGNYFYFIVTHKA